MAINQTEARNAFTKEFIARWNELNEIRVMSFFRSFFDKSITDTKYVSIEVLRGTEKVAVDIVRGTNGNRNTFSKSTEKVFEPPYFSENFDMTSLDKYDRIWGSGAENVPASAVISTVASAIEKTMVLKNKIERAYELQAAQVFKSGIVTLKSGDNIDFKRSADSMKVLTGTLSWNNDLVHPGETLKTGAIFMRTKGKCQGGVFDVTFGTNAIIAFLEHPKIKGSNDLKTLALSDIQSPTMNSVGGVSHGVYTYGSFKFNLWSYPEYYDDASNVSTPYVDDDNIIMVPAMGKNFKFAFAGVPAILRDPSNVAMPEMITQVAADYVIDNYVDRAKKAHLFEISSAGIAIPVSVDRIFSAKVTDPAYAASLLH